MTECENMVISTLAESRKGRDELSKRISTNGWLIALNGAFICSHFLWHWLES